jgi:hypothetical protein
VNRDVIMSAREAGDEEIILMLLEKFEESTLTVDDESTSMLGSLFERFCFTQVNDGMESLK